MMSKLGHLVVVYIEFYSLYLNVHFHLMTLKIRFKIFLQVKFMVLYEKQFYESTHPCYGSTHTECILKSKLLHSMRQHTRLFGRHITQVSRHMIPLGRLLLKLLQAK